MNANAIAIIKLIYWDTHNITYSMNFIDEMYLGQFTPIDDCLGLLSEQERPMTLGQFVLVDMAQVAQGPLMPF